MRFTLQSSQAAFTPPASHWAANSTNPYAAPMGMRLRLKASYDISGFPPQSTVILTALQQYGMIMADNGSSMFITGAPNDGWDNDDLAALKTVPASAFEVVLMDPLYTSANVPKGPAPVISSFTASSSTVLSGSPVTLNWTVTNADYNIVSPQVGVIRGTSATITPTATTTYKLYSTNQYGRSTAQVTVTVQANDLPTTTALTSSLNPSVTGKPVSFTATVSPVSAGAVPTGEITLQNGSTVFATLKLANGTVKYSTTALPAGSNSITAVYSGDMNYSGSASAPLNQVVLATTKTTIVSSPNPSSYGQAVTFTATVDSSIGPPPDGETVTFEQGSTVLETGTLSGGTATFSTSTLAPGTKSIKAVYGGDASFATSASSGVSQVIAKASSTTVLTSSLNPSVYGQSVTFTATVSPAFGGTPTGTVVFKDGTKTLKSLTLSGGVASYTTSMLAVGSHSITATYNGSVDYGEFGAAHSNRQQNSAVTAVLYLFCSGCDNRVAAVMAERMRSPIRGRGALSAPDPRFDSERREAVDDGWYVEDNLPPLRTTVTVATLTRSIITRNKSPDVGFDRSINHTRVANMAASIASPVRPTPISSLSPGLDFETRIFASPTRRNCCARNCRPRATRRPSSNSASIPMPISRSSARAVDPRRFFEVLPDSNIRSGILTKSALIERDLDILGPMAAKGLVKCGSRHDARPFARPDDGAARRAPRGGSRRSGRSGSSGVPVGGHVGADDPWD